MDIGKVEERGRKKGINEARQVEKESACTPEVLSRRVTDGHHMGRF